jgi:hypothetical protein
LAEDPGAVTVLKKHRPPTREDGVVDEALAVLQDEGRWAQIHPDGTFSAVRHATLRLEATSDAVTASVLFVLENLLKTAYNAAWRLVPSAAGSVPVVPHGPVWRALWP